MMSDKIKLALLGSVMLLMISIATRAVAADAICYNCPPQWADWASQLAAIKENLGLDIPHDNKNSGQTLSQLITEKNNPVADVAYYGVSFGIAAKNEGVVDAYKPAFWDEIPDGLKDPDGFWFTIHSGTLGLFVNVGMSAGASWTAGTVKLGPQHRARLPSGVGCQFQRSRIIHHGYGQRNSTPRRVSTGRWGISPGRFSVYNMDRLQFNLPQKRGEASCLNRNRRSAGGVF